MGLKWIGLNESNLFFLQTDNEDWDYEMKKQK